MKPNILIIHCHDLGDTIGCYPGNSAITPALDRLADEGVVFEHHFAASPTCSPSRGAMYSGLMPNRNGLQALASGGHWELSPEIPTFPRRLHDSGYATASFGVWHVHRSLEAFGVETHDGESVCEKTTENALAFLEARDPERPFYLFLGVREPHQPFTSLHHDLQPPEQVTLPPYLADAPEVRQEVSRLLGDVSRVDACVEKLLDYLQRTGLEGNTLVVFTTDHGLGLPLAKGTLYDPGAKIALVCRWPGRIQGGRRCADLTSNTDIFPTLLEAVGEAGRIPADLDGHSLWPYLERGEDVGHEQIYLEQTWHDFYEPIRAIRTRYHKLIRNFEPGTGWQIAADIVYTPTVEVMRQQLLDFPRPEYELYDLQADPVERNNLAGQAQIAEIEAQLKRQLDDWLRAANDRILDGVVPAPVGYWEHFLAKPQGPGALPIAGGNDSWLTIRWPFGATRHDCIRTP